MTGKLQDKVAIVTGGAGGFGKGIAANFVAEGAKVIIADFAEDAGRQTASELKCEFFKTDVTSAADWESLRQFCDSKFGRIDVVVNNAGTTYRNKPTNDVTEADFDKCFNVNVKSIYHASHILVPYQQSLTSGSGFSWINIASTAGIRPRPGLTWYNASKAAVINATKTLAVEYAPSNIRFNAVCPVLGLGTGLSQEFLGKPENEKAFLATIPLGRGTTPQDMGSVCAFLASDEASFLTGMEVPVDGGRCV